MWPNFLTMKEIDPKSLIIGVLATALVFACTDSNNNNQKAGAVPSLVTEAHAATSKDERGKWDDEQQWEIAHLQTLFDVGDVKIEKDRVGGRMQELALVKGGWEPFAYATERNAPFFRRRVK